MVEIVVVDCASFDRRVSQFQQTMGNTSSAAESHYISLFVDVPKEVRRFCASKRQKKKTAKCE